MQKTSEGIIDQLTPSDRRRIAEWAGCSRMYVDLVLRGQRADSTETTRFIHEAAIAIASAFQGLDKLISDSGPEFKPSRKKYWIQIKAI